MRLVISHSTTYHYESPVPYGLQQIRLQPRSQPGQNVLSWDTRVDGGTRQVMFDDHFGNTVELVRLSPGTTETTVTAEGIVDTSDTAGVIARHLGYAPLWLFLRSTSLTEPGPGVDRLTTGLRDEFDDDIELLHTLSARILDTVAYEQGRTTVETTAEGVIEVGRGVCQDHAHVFVAAARSMDFPARYVSGYLTTDDVAQQDATHAWGEVWLDNLGWIGFDVSNAISPDDRYVRVATGLDYRDAAPISGLRFGAGDEILRVTLQVQQ